MKKEGALVGQMMHRKGEGEMIKKQSSPTGSRTLSRRSLERYFEKEIKRLEHEIREQQEYIKQPGETRGELFEEAGEITEQAQNIAVLEQLNKELLQVQTARKRLEQGLYGTCEDCGRPIPEERLKALPYATRCVRCQTLRGPNHKPEHN
jgi:DnaK suppressor protein